MADDNQKMGLLMKLSLVLALVVGIIAIPFSVQLYADTRYQNKQQSEYNESLDRIEDTEIRAQMALKHAQIDQTIRLTQAKHSEEYCTVMRDRMNELIGRLDMELDFVGSLDAIQQRQMNTHEDDLGRYEDCIRAAQIILFGTGAE